MTTENTTVETVSVPSNDNVESKPKRTMVQASEDRIAFHVAMSAEKAARLSTLKPGKAYDRCAASLAKNDAFIALLRSELAARVAKAQEKLGTVAA
jgi:hypothetical protein